MCWQKRLDQVAGVVQKGVEDDVMAKTVYHGAKLLALAMVQDDKQ